MKKRMKSVFFAIGIFILGFIVSIIYQTLPERLKKHGIGADELSSLIMTPYGVSTENDTLALYGKPYILPYVTDDYQVHYVCEEKEDNTIQISADKSGIVFNSTNITLYSKQAVKLYSYEMHEENGETELIALNSPNWEHEMYIFNMENREDMYERFDYVTLYFQYEYYDEDASTWFYPFVSLRIYI